MNELKFNSQVCTSTEQSKRLLDLGLKSETADMCIDLYYEDEPFVVHNKINYSKQTEFVPAWSLHRLIEICSESYYTFNIDVHKMDLYDFIISTFEHLKKQGKINKEYLKQ